MIDQKQIEKLEKCPACGNKGLDYIPVMGGGHWECSECGWISEGKGPMM